MSSLHGTQASFDPLSAQGDTSDEVFTTVFNSTPAAAAVPTASPSFDDAPPSSEYDSFMTARSAMSYMTASQGGGASAALAAAVSSPPAGAPPPSSSLFRRLPDRPPSNFAGGDGRDNSFLSSVHEKASLPQRPPPVDDSNPFAVAALEPTPSTSQPVAAMGPLSFCSNDDAQAAAPQTAAAFAMPLDLYDTPDDAFARPAATAAAAAVPPPPTASSTRQSPQLPPLYDFAREFSRVLPVSEDPVSPVDASVANATAWYDSDQTPGCAAAAPFASFGGDGAGAGGSVRSGGGAPLPAVSSAGGGSASGGFWAAAAGVPAASPYAAAALLTNTVSVHSPRKAVAPSLIPGLPEPYISYRVTSRSAVSPETTVERRFRDVVALGELLQSLHPGCFLPPRPSRNAVEGRRMQPGFIEERREGIEKFLRRLVVHPVLGPSEVTQVWLHTAAADLRSSPEWLRLQPAAPPGLAKSTARLLAQVVGRERTVPSPLELTRPAAARGDVYRLVHERAAALKGVLARLQPSPLELDLREAAVAMQERTESLLALSRRADQLVAKSGKYGRAGGKVAAALAAGGEAEAEAEAGGGAVGSTPATAMKVAAEGFEKVSKLYGVATDASAKHLTPLHDWLAAVPGSTAALAARERCLLTLATLQADEAAARARLAEAADRKGEAAAAAAAATASTSPPPQKASAVKKLESLRSTVAQLRAAVGAARDEYERVGARNSAEMAAFKGGMSRELANAVREFALVQLAAAQKAHGIWVDTAGQLTTLAAAAATAAAGGGSGVRLAV